MKKLIPIIILIILIFCTSVYAKDTKPPVGTLKINLHNKVTKTRLIELTVNVSDKDGSGVDKMCISSKLLTCTKWVKYKPVKYHRLEAGNGAKKVCVWVKDRAGHVTGPQCDMIILQEE